jgi:hypothetical protein
MAALAAICLGFAALCGGVVPQAIKHNDKFAAVIFTFAALFLFVLSMLATIKAM